MTVAYDLGDYHISILLKLGGSLIPRAIFVALPFSVAAAIMCVFINVEEDERLEWLTDLGDSNVWAALNGVLSLVLAFRTSQALDRFWEGSTLLHQMRAEWLDGCSSLFAFAAGGKMLKPVEHEEFCHTLVRLMSLMHAFALYEIKELGNEHFDVVDIEGLDDDSLEFLQSCSHLEVPRVEIVLHWVQQLITESIRQGVVDIAPPIVSRVYQELSSGMVHLHNAKKITDTQFPFPYAQFITFALVVHAALTPVHVCAYVANPICAAIGTMMPIFAFWCINFTAGELENPFGDDLNDLPLSKLQGALNSSLLMLLDDRVQRIPCLSWRAEKNATRLRAMPGLQRSRTDTIHLYEKSAIRASLGLCTTPSSMKEGREESESNTSYCSSMKESRESHDDLRTNGDGFDSETDVRSQESCSTPPPPADIVPIVPLRFSQRRHSQKTRPELEALAQWHVARKNMWTRSAPECGYGEKDAAVKGHLNDYAQRKALSASTPYVSSESTALHGVQLQFAADVLQAQLCKQTSCSPASWPESIRDSFIADKTTEMSSAQLVLPASPYEAPQNESQDSETPYDSVGTTPEAEASRELPQLELVQTFFPICNPGRPRVLDIWPDGSSEAEAAGDVPQLELVKTVLPISYPASPRVHDIWPDGFSEGRVFRHSLQLAVGQETAAALLDAERDLLPPPTPLGTSLLFHDACFQPGRPSTPDGGDDEGQSQQRGSRDRAFAV